MKQEDDVYGTYPCHLINVKNKRLLSEVCSNSLTRMLKADGRVEAASDYIVKRDSCRID